MDSRHRCSKRWILALLAVILTLVDIYSIPNITITADIDMSVSAVTSQIQQPKSTTSEAETDSTRREEEEADAREVVTTRAYNNKKVAYITFGSFNQGPARFQNLVLDALRTWLKDNVIFYVLNKEWKTKFEDACNQPSNRQECKRVVPIFVDCTVIKMMTCISVQLTWTTF
jgi:hypothetical protein